MKALNFSTALVVGFTALLYGCGGNSTEEGPFGVNDEISAALQSELNSIMQAHKDYDAECRQKGGVPSLKGGRCDFPDKNTQ